jgi:geranylgeranyl diphosphate synthase, type I
MIARLRGGDRMTSALPPVLRTARELVDPELRKAVGLLDEDTRRVSEYHFGWTHADGSPDGSGGKALRPALVILSARAAGAADEPLPITAATAVELVHNFSLLHDDLMDGDTARRHRPTAWTVFGRPTALLTGDALLALAIDMLVESPARYAVAAARSLSSAVRRLIAGQSADLDFEQRMDVTLEECLRMAEGKTAALLACAASIGALSVGATTETVQRLSSFGHELGMAFQLVDDLLGLWGDPDVTGKPVLSDLRARKKTAPVVHALTSDTPEGQRLRDLYAVPALLTEEQLVEAADLVGRTGSRDWAQEECARRLDTALRHLALVDGERAAMDSLTELADFIVRRQW